jgi:hypothetical protein
VKKKDSRPKVHMRAYLGGLPAWVGTCELRER